MDHATDEGSGLLQLTAILFSLLPSMYEVDVYLSTIKMFIYFYLQIVESSYRADGTTSSKLQVRFLAQVPEFEVKIVLSVDVKFTDIRVSRMTGKVSIATPVTKPNYRPTTAL